MNGNASPCGWPLVVCDPSLRLCAARSSPLENSIASTSIFVYQATKSQRWMPWRLKPMKDVGGCEKPRGAAYQALIRGYPNGETHRHLLAVLRSEYIGPVEGTRG